MTTGNLPTSGLDLQDYTPSTFEFDWNIEVSAWNWLRDQCNLVRYPLLTARYRRLIPRTTRVYKPDLVVGGGVGLPLSIIRQKIAGLRRDQPPIRRLLILGCGTAWGVGQWMRLKPTEVIGVDLYSFRRAWTAIEKIGRQHGVAVKFEQTDLTDMTSIPDDWADVVVSDAVFEHVKDLDTALLTIRRKLRQGGLMYAGYGPLWHSPGGDHYSCRGGLPHVYNHLLLDPPAYRDFFQRHLQAEENPQAGGRYVPLDLFSKLSSDQYLALYTRLGFIQRFLAIETCPLAFQFRQSCQEQWQRLLRAYPTMREEEFAIKSHYVILQTVNEEAAGSGGEQHGDAHPEVLT